jgi:hypothetical protein
MTPAFWAWLRPLRLGGRTTNDAQQSKATGASLAPLSATDSVFEVLSADELEPIRDACVRARHLASSMFQLTPLLPPLVVFVPGRGQLSRALRWPASGSWELNHIDPRERTTGELLKSAAHLEVAEVDGHEAEPIDELRYVLLCRRVVSRQK